MARTFTLGTLVTRCQQRCDAEDQEFITDTEWKGLISTAYAELYSLVAETGMRYFEAQHTITTNGTDVAYPLPATFLATVGVDYVVNAQGERRALHELMPQERNSLRGISGSSAAAYEMIGTELHLWPKPPAGQTYTLTYVPQPTDLSSAGDNTAVDVITPDGEAFLVWAVAVQAKEKEGVDASLAIAERERARERVVQWATLRSLHGARRKVPDDIDSVFDSADWRY
jgi:hypothetical protein